MRPTRRALLQSIGGGFGALALSALLDELDQLDSREFDSASSARGARRVSADEVHGADSPRASLSRNSAQSALAPRRGHFPAKARAVIQLCQNGGPSQMDLFDHKPELSKRNGQPHPEQVETFQLGNKNVLL
ncbi:MAG TPA: DUF1501 domain-containing protein, partial [Pirellulaceae bacterium]|nr:DUF1501 domain-containing protein [Pirellulaceae bacterium]